LQWADIDYNSQQISVRRSWTGGKTGKPKSAASKAPVALVPLLAGFIREWQQQTPYGQPTDPNFGNIPHEIPVFGLRHFLRPRRRAGWNGCAVPPGETDWPDVLHKWYYVPAVYAVYGTAAMFALLFLRETRDIKFEDLDNPASNVIAARFSVAVANND
jgi:hypothetical protein